MAKNKKDPYTNSAFSLSNKIYRQAWNACYIILFRPSPKILFRWRNALLRLFGAKIGRGACIHQSARIWYPANLECEDMVAIAENVDIYNPKKITLKSHAILSQGSYLCGASHDYNDAEFKLFSKEIIIAEYAWVCAKSIVLPGITIKSGAVLAIGSIATSNLEPWTVYAGVPAKPIKTRINNYAEK